MKSEFPDLITHMNKMKKIIIIIIGQRGYKPLVRDPPMGKV